jgi:hypothetical protein
MPEKKNLSLLNDIPSTGHKMYVDISTHKRGRTHLSLAKGETPKRKCMEKKEKKSKITLPKCYYSLREFLIYSDKKSKTFVLADPQKSKMRRENIIKLWATLIQQRSKADPLFKGIFLKCGFINFFARMMLYTFNELYADNTTATKAVLNRVRNKVELMKAAFKDELMSHTVKMLFECVNKTSSEIDNLNISKNSSHKEIIECFLVILMSYYSEFKKKTVTCEESSQIFTKESMLP